MVFHCPTAHCPLPYTRVLPIVFYPRNFIESLDSLGKLRIRDSQVAAPRIYSDTADSLRGGRQERVLPQPAGRSRFCILGDASPETRPAGAEL